MKINEMKFSSMQPGLKFRGIKNKDKIGKVIYVDYLDDLSVYYAWEDGEGIGNWYHVDCECEVVLDENNNPVVDRQSIEKQYLREHTKQEENLITYYKKYVKVPGNKIFGLKLPQIQSERLPALIEAISAPSLLKEPSLF